jgi:L-asparagine transporter-like permease
MWPPGSKRNRLGRDCAEHCADYRHLVHHAGGDVRHWQDDALSCNGNLAPRWVKDETDVPRRGILFSGLCMLAALWFGLLFPRVYLFLVSAGGFALRFTYMVILATHLKFRRKNGCPPDGKCQMWGYPYSSYAVLLLLFISVVSMPFVPGQGSGLIAGGFLLALFSYGYWAAQKAKHGWASDAWKTGFSMEFAEDITLPEKREEK